MTKRLAVVHDYNGLITALRARQAELEITNETLDHVAGITPGYAGKLFSPKPIRSMGPMSLWAILGCLGLRLTVETDPEQLAKIRSRLTKRLRPLRSPRAALAGLEALLQGRHQVDDIATLGRVVRAVLDDPLALLLDLLLDQRLQRVDVAVLELARVELAGLLGDQRLGHVEQVLVATLRKGAPLMRPVMEWAAKRLWTEDLEYAERLYAVRAARRRS